MHHRSIEEIVETPIDEVTAGDLARLRAFYEDVLGEQHGEARSSFAQLLDPEERLGDVLVDPVVRVAARAFR